MTDIHYSGEILKLFHRTPALKGRIEYVIRSYFPEIQSVSVGRASKNAYYDPRNHTVRLTGNSSVYVIGHELMHYLQDGHAFPGNKGIYPKGERACDLYLFARSPDLVADFWQSYDGSYIGSAIRVDALRKYFTREEGREMVHRVCAEAVALREKGKHGYIRWAERTINSEIAKKRYGDRP